MKKDCLGLLWSYLFPKSLLVDHHPPCELQDTLLLEKNFEEKNSDAMNNLLLTTATYLFSLCILFSLLCFFNTVTFFFFQIRTEVYTSSLVELQQHSIVY